MTRRGRRLARAAASLAAAGLAACHTAPPVASAGAPVPLAMTGQATPVAHTIAPMPEPALALMTTGTPVALTADPADQATGQPSPDVADDLWPRIRAGLALPASDDEAVEAEWRWYADHPAYLDRTFGRAEPYIHHIVTAVSDRGMPLEFALLPVVESAYDAFAYSHGRAAGLWQIIPGTGRRFGLKQNWWYDGRRDVVAATEAALDYLQLLHAEFDGDWLLALAGYNAGEGNVRRAIRRNRQRGLPTDFWHLDLPRETRGYVPKLLALGRLVADPGAAGVTLPDLSGEPYFAAVVLDGQLDLALAAELAEVPVEEIYRLNPAFNRWATDPAGPHRLLLPVAAAPALAAGLTELPASERVSWHRHTIRSGDTLSTIARDYDTTAALLRQTNGLSSSRIRAGDILLVPVASRPLDQYSLSADARLARLTAARSGGARYTVRSGDSLWTIARDQGVSVRTLARWNGMAPGDTLSVGRELVIGDGAGRRSVATPPADTTRRIEYTVRNGDSLWRIGSKFRVSVNQIKRWNKLSGDRVLRPGQRLVMYVNVADQTAGG